MAKLIGGVPKTQHDAQDRANEQASHLLGWQAKQIRDQKGADAANQQHIERRHEMAQRPTQNVRMVSPLFVGKKQADSVKDALKPQVPSGKGRT